MPSFFRRALFWLRRRQMGDDLRLEMETHRAMREEALSRDGVADPGAASRRALGNVALAEDDARDVWGWPRLDSFVRDVTYASRGLVRQPGFAATAILTIALGTAALTSVLSVVYAVLLRPTPYPNADRIVQIVQVVGGRQRTEVSPGDLLGLRAAKTSLSHVSFAWFGAASLAGDGLPERARLVYTDADGFAILGTQPLLGRLPNVADGAPGATAVVVLGHALFSTRFGGDPDVIGRSMQINGEPHVVIGVMPPGFRFPAPYWAAGDMWVPRGPAHPFWPQDRSLVFLGFGLLEEGTSMARAEGELASVAAGLDAKYPATGAIGLGLTTWAEEVRAESQPRLLLILAASAVVLLIVGVNIANLLLSRAVDRHRELAARIALGAGRGRLVRQLVTETLVLFAAGGVFGVVLAIWGSRTIAAMPSFSIPRMDESVVDVPVALLALAATLAVGLVVGIAPAVQATSNLGREATGLGARGASMGRKWRRVQLGLVGAEVGLALVLLCGAGVLLEGARRLASVDPGFDPRDVMHARVTLPPEAYAAASRQAAFHDRLVEQLRASSGVSAAAVMNVPPGVGGASAPSVRLEDDPPPASDRDWRRADVRAIGTGYFETLGLAPRAGRLMTATDKEPVALVNETFVRDVLGGRAAVGARVNVRLRGGASGDRQLRTIVGVVPDLREQTLYQPVPPVVYVPLRDADGRRLAILLRSNRTEADLTQLIRASVAAADPELAAYGFMPLADLMQSELSLNMLNLRLIGVLAAAAMLLAVIGVYGVTAHAVRQRTREIAIRVALGIRPGAVPRLLIGEGAVVIAAGLAIGAVAAVWSAALLRSMVYGIERTSVATFFLAGLLLAVVVLAGCYLPARRAARVDPAAVLRAE